jgi:hypothetical protein
MGIETQPILIAFYWDKEKKLCKLGARTYLTWVQVKLKPAVISNPLSKAWFALKGASGNPLPWELCLTHICLNPCPISIIGL